MFKTLSKAAAQEIAFKTVIDTQLTIKCCLNLRLGLLMHVWTSDQIQILSSKFTFSTNTFFLLLFFLEGYGRAAEIIRRPRTGLMRGAKAPTVYWDVLGRVGRFFFLDLYILYMYILYYIYLSIYLSVYLSICLCKYLYIDYLFPSTCLLSTHLPFITLGTFYLRCRQIGVFSVR